ncbi:MAG: 3-mercaptopyruvate sulfurtransferase [Sphingomonadales bacterium]
MTPEMLSDLVSTDWLAQRLDAPDIRIVEASWHLPDSGRDAGAEYKANHIPGAVFFDIDDIADSDNPLPHMLPSPEKFASRVRRLGIGDGHRVVIYDRSACRSAARAWWMFRAFGCQDVAVLDGGFEKWLAEALPLDDLPPMPRERHFSARFDNLLVRNKAQVARAVASGKEQILDARAANRFQGLEPEPRPGLRSGHMPGARNLPFAQVLRQDGTFKAPDQLFALFTEAGIDMSAPVITTCGSGISACVLSLALHLAGHREVAVYDGSWSEWGADPEAPIAGGDTV